MFNSIHKAIFRRREAYRSTLLDNRGELLPESKVMMADLKRFCCATKSTASLTAAEAVDPYAMAMREGRREVWNRINSYLFIDEKVIQNLTEED